MISRMFEARRTARAYREFFDSESGRIVLKDMMRTSLFFRDTGVCTDAELRQIEGARNLVRRALKLAHLDERQLEQMMREPVVNGDDIDG